jgi:5-methylcytosine-specific restriction enzyme subunit McrC
MLRLTILERGRIERVADLEPSATKDQFGTPDRLRVPAVLFDRLLKAEGAREDRGEKPIFTWGRNRATVGPWVGVLQVPGLQLELLPKIELPPKAAPLQKGWESSNTDSLQGEEAPAATIGRLNLLHMLDVAGLTSFRSRGKANLRTRRGTVNDQLLAQFLARLTEELRRGYDHNYLNEEDNLLTKRGRLLISKQVARNSAQQHRFFCRFDALGEQTQINRVLRTACDRLARWNLPLTLQRDVIEALAILDGVEPIADVSAISEFTFTRQNDRFQDIYDFALLILNDQTPDPRAGNNQTFSLLFDMDKVFEGFIAQFIKRYVQQRIPGLTLHAQAKGKLRYLFDPTEKSGSRGALELKPDLLFECRTGNETRLLVGDTKWKVLDPKAGGKPSRDDFYQLYAYVRRFGCDSAFLLYPRASEVAPHEFHALDAGANSVGQVGTRFVNLSVDLNSSTGRNLLADELEAILRGALAVAERPPAAVEAAQ